MKKFALEKCRKIFLEDIFSHSRKLFSEFARTKFLSLLYMMISLAYKISCFLFANHNPGLRCVIYTGVALELHCSQSIRIEKFFHVYH